MSDNLNTATEALQPSKGIYATFDAEGRPTGFYRELTHGRKLLPVGRMVQTDNLREFPKVVYDMVPNPDCKIPEDAVLITREQWRGYVDAMQVPEIGGD
jgi:hypothetical protein